MYKTQGKVDNNTRRPINLDLVTAERTITNSLKFFTHKHAPYTGKSRWSAVSERFSFVFKKINEWSPELSYRNEAALTR